MEERDTQPKNDPQSNQSTPSTSPRQTTTTTTTASPSLCKVCGEDARYSYYGVTVCQSCKVFFKRNAINKSKKLQCDSGDHCEININNRKICAACRLKKCLAVGMKPELIRSSWSQKTIKDRKNNSKKKSSTSTSTSTSTDLVRYNHTNQSSTIDTLNLLERDQSSLSVEDWNHLSNLVHCFDQHSEPYFIKDFLEEQNNLPPKFRFKYSSVNEFFKSMMSKVQLAFEKNRDAISLSSDDRNILLRGTTEYTSILGGAFLLRQSKLFDNPSFIKSAEIIFRPQSIYLIKRLIDQLDSDSTLIKMMFGIIAFMVSDYTVYGNTPSDNLNDLKKILFIQDSYTELIWRYLIYKHNYNDAVKCFSNFIRCLLLLNHTIVESHSQEQFTDLINSVIQATELKLNINQ